MASLRRHHRHARHSSRAHHARGQRGKSPLVAALNHWNQRIARSFQALAAEQARTPATSTSASAAAQGWSRRLLTQLASVLQSLTRARVVVALAALYLLVTLLLCATAAWRSPLRRRVRWRARLARLAAVAYYASCVATNAVLLAGLAALVPRWLQLTPTRQSRLAQLLRATTSAATAHLGDAALEQLLPLSALGKDPLALQLCFVMIGQSTASASDAHLFRQLLHVFLALVTPQPTTARTNCHSTTSAARDGSKIAPSLPSHCSCCATAVLALLLPCH